MEATFVALGLSTNGVGKRRLIRLMLFWKYRAKNWKVHRGRAHYQHSSSKMQERLGSTMDQAEKQAISK